MPFNNFIDQNGIPKSYNDDHTCIVRTADELSNFIDLPPGSIAYTAGYEHVWQMNPNKEWVELEI
jgi:hypothetical protein